MRYSDFRNKRRMTVDKIEERRSNGKTSIKMQAAIDACKRSTCELCGGMCKGEPHHVKSRGAGGPDIPENLIQLCGNCHRAAHDGRISRERLYRVIARRLRVTDEELRRRLDAAEGKDGSFDTTELRTIEEEARRDSRRKAVPFF